MAGIRFRPAGHEDFPAIIGLIGCREEQFLAFPNSRWPLTLGQLHRLTEARLDLTVCLADGTIAGFADLYDMQPGEWAFIGNVIVGATYRGRGIGRALINHMLGIIYQRNVLPWARISVFSDNVPALALYQRMGFTHYAEEIRTAPDRRQVKLLHLERKNSG